MTQYKTHTHNMAGKRLYIDICNRHTQGMQAPVHTHTHTHSYSFFWLWCSRELWLILILTMFLLCVTCKCARHRGYSSLWIRKTKFFRGKVRKASIGNIYATQDSTWFGLCTHLIFGEYSKQPVSNLAFSTSKGFKPWNKLLHLVKPL